MSIIRKNCQDEQQKISNEDAEVLSNFFRCLTMLEKTLERLARHRWYDKKQSPDIYFEILSTISWLRTWAKDYKVFSNNQVFQESMGNFITGIADQVSILIETSHYSPGKKKEGKTLRQKQQARIQRSIKEMLDHLVEYSYMLEDPDTEINDNIKTALAESLEKSFLRAQKQRYRKIILSQRGQKSFIFPWQDPQKYHDFVEDKNRFRREVVTKLKKLSTGYRTQTRMQVSRCLQNERIP